MRSINASVTDFRLIEGHLADFRGLRKILIAPEQSKLPSSGLRRSKENNFVYRMVVFKFKIQWKKRSESLPQNVQGALTRLANC